MTEDEIYNALQRLAKDNNVELTENAIKIARFRARADIPLNVCPCEQNNKNRGCISPLCMMEIQTLGKCHCQCFKRHD